MTVHKEVKDSILNTKYLRKKGFINIRQRDNLLILTGNTVPVHFNLDSRRVEIYTNRGCVVLRKSITIMELSTIEYIIRRIIKKYYSFL